MAGFRLKQLGINPDFIYREAYFTFTISPGKHIITSPFVIDSSNSGAELDVEWTSNLKFEI